MKIRTRRKHNLKNTLRKTTNTAPMTGCAGWERAGAEEEHAKKPKEVLAFTKGSASIAERRDTGSASARTRTSKWWGRTVDGVRRRAMGEGKSGQPGQGLGSPFPNKVEGTGLWPSQKGSWSQGKGTWGNGAYCFEDECSQRYSGQRVQC